MRNIGFWRSSKISYENLPWPGDFIDPNWPKDVRDRVADNLDSPDLDRCWLGYSGCRICGYDRNGTRYFIKNGYLYPEGLSHYVREHNVRLPEFKDFGDHL
jgi:hypothetical protein